MPTGDASSDNRQLEESPPRAESHKERRSRTARIQIRLRERIASIERLLTEKDLSQIATIDLLKSALDGLEKSNAHLSARMESEWDKPKRLFYGAMTVIGLFFGVNVLGQYSTLNELSIRAKALSEETRESAKQRLEAISELSRFKQDVGQTFKQIESRNEDEVETARKQIDALKVSSEQIQTSMKKQLEELDATRNQLIQADAAAHHAISLVSLGRDQLGYRRNPRRALFYAEQAGAVLKDAHAKLGSGSNLFDILERLWVPVLTLKAECHFQIEDKQILLKSTASDLIAKDSSCLEGHYYLGLALLHEIIAQSPETEEFKVPVQKAISSLEKAVSEEHEGNLAQVFLAANYLLANQLSRAENQAKAYLSHLPDTTMERESLPVEVKAQITIAASILELSAYALNESNTLHTFRDCRLEVGAIGSGEARLIQAIFQFLVKYRSRLNSDENRANRLGMFCLEGMIAFQRAGGKCAPWPEGLREQFGLRNYDLPVLSRNKRLGKVEGMTLTMEYVEEIHIPATLGRDEKHAPIPRRSLEYFEAKYSVGDEIPERRYIPFGKKIAQIDEDDGASEVVVKAPAEPVRNSPQVAPKKPLLPPAPK